jgi:hypothetical protein
MVSFLDRAQLSGERVSMSSRVQNARMLYRKLKCSHNFLETNFTMAEWMHPNRLAV